MKSAPVGSLSPEYVLLGLLARGPAHGYELHRKLSCDLNQVWHLSQSQIYNILNRLESQDYIHGSILEQEKLPAKRSFEITDSGVAHFEDWLFTPTRSSVRAIRVEFTTRLYFALALDLKLAGELVSAQIAETRSGLQKLILLQSNIPEDQLFNRLGLDLRIRQLKSILEWLDSCLGLVSTDVVGTLQT
jgi:DNA-binding PadR family transcriptional regulator